MTHDPQLDQTLAFLRSRATAIAGDDSADMFEKAYARAVVHLPLMIVELKPVIFAAVETRERMGKEGLDEKGLEIIDGTVQLAAGIAANVAASVLLSISPRPREARILLKTLLRHFESELGRVLADDADRIQQGYNKDGTPRPFDFRTHLNPENPNG